MDQSISLVSKGIRASMSFAATVVILSLSVDHCLAETTFLWPKTLRRKLAKLDHAQGRPGSFGLYVKDLESGEELSYRGDQTWYIASGVKVPIALEVLRQSDQGKLHLDDRIRISSDDYVDGAGQTNFQPPGTRVPVRALLEWMLIHSDNTASDLLLRKVGLGRVNRLMNKQVNTGFWPITMLRDVRRLTYSQIDSKAVNLKGRDLLLLRASRTDQQRLAMLGTLLGISPARLSQARLDQAYAKYYKTRLNSATLRAYGLLLEKTWEGRILSPASRALLLDIMERAETGQRRIQAGLHSNLVFAHKTGTQRQRICDFGIVRDREQPARKPLIVTACTAGFAKDHQAEAVLRAIGQAIAHSGLFPSFN